MAYPHAPGYNPYARKLTRLATKFKQLIISQPFHKADGESTDSPNPWGTYPSLVNLTVRGCPGQTGNLVEYKDYNDNVLGSIGPSGVPSFSNGLVSPATGLGGLGVAHALYSFAVDGGAIGPISPVGAGAVIPANAIIIGATINPTTALTSGGSATIAIGTTAGSSATSLLAATAVASFTIDALINGVPTIAAPIKMTAAGTVKLTVAAAALTAGILEVFVYYVVAAGA